MLHLNGAGWLEHCISRVATTSKKGCVRYKTIKLDNWFDYVIVSVSRFVEVHNSEHAGDCQKDRVIREVYAGANTSSL
jgi:hypothetical protein